MVTISGRWDHRALEQFVGVFATLDVAWVSWQFDRAGRVRVYFVPPQCPIKDRALTSAIRDAGGRMVGVHR